MQSRQKQDFSSAFEQLNQQLQSATTTLTNYYLQAMQQIDKRTFIFNNSIIKELRLYLGQITKVAGIAGNGVNLFLLQISQNDEEVLDIQEDIDFFIDKNRDCNHIAIRKSHLEDRAISRIRARCTNVNSIALVSNPMKVEQIICDQDILKVQPFTKLSALSIRGSNVSDAGLQNLSEGFRNLKELDISKCKFIGANGVTWLSGYKYVSIKANQIQGISQHAIINLITTSYNLNYLELSNIKGYNYDQLLSDIKQVYLENTLNFKWLQIICNAGTILFVNKLSYLTHLTTVDAISDRQIEILLGQQSLINGLYVNCCEELHSDTIQFLVKRCNKLKRLGLKRFVKLNDSLVGDLVAAIPSLQYIEISQCSSLSGRSLIHMANQLSGLREIRLPRCGNVGDEGMIYLVQKMASLRVIDLAYCKNIRECLPELEGLNLAKCDITDEGVSYISETLGSLTSLVLDGCEGLTDASLGLVVMRLRKLRKLSVEWCAVSQKCVGFISQNLSQLQELNLNYCNAVCDEEVMGLAKYATKLHCLCLSSCDKITKKGFLRMFSSLRNLRHIELRQCEGLTDMALEHLCDSARGNLIHLDISWCTQVSDAGLLHLSQFQQQILYLNLGGCVEISDSAIGWICTTMTRLEYLNLSLCQKLTDQSIFQISKNLTNLRVLFVCELRKITDSSISNLTVLPNLQELHLSGCTEITSSSLIALLHNLQKLQCLNISECSNIFAESLILLVERMRNLKSFSIASIEVTDRFLEMVGEYMQRLRMLNLEYCRKITEEGVLKMVYRTPSLIKLDIQNTDISQKAKKVIFDELSSRNLFDIVR